MLYCMIMVIINPDTSLYKSGYYMNFGKPSVNVICCCYYNLNGKQGQTAHKLKFATFWEPNKYLGPQ